eukprot:TRINITY_DN3127_c0_g1_i1.p1 TRINITY_DN3127_c0_g1~~TRINITY_DN3127_c0_g1_i1.p1  ORF type:complete len:287 (+),score=57.79 TRINITY_DN3127_c0_g1_i1:358-1218(+)
MSLFTPTTHDPPPQVLLETVLSICPQNDKFSLDYLQALRIAAEVAQGMIYLHSRNVVHRDLKPHNVLIDAQGRAKIADFGLSRVLKKVGFGNSRTTMGTPEYLSPEIIARETFSKQSDVYAFAIMMWELITRETPYGDWRSIQIIMNVTDGMRPTFSPHVFCPTRLKRLVKQCWSQDAKDRPDFPTILRTLDSLMVERIESEKRVEQHRKHKGMQIRKETPDVSHNAVSPARFRLPGLGGDDNDESEQLYEQKQERLPRGLSGPREKKKKYRLRGRSSETAKAHRG